MDDTTTGVIVKGGMEDTIKHFEDWESHGVFKDLEQVKGHLMTGHRVVGVVSALCDKFLVGDQEAVQRLIKVLADEKEPLMDAVEIILRGIRLEDCPGCGKRTVDMEEAEPACTACNWAQ